MKNQSILWAIPLLVLFSPWTTVFGVEKNPPLFPGIFADPEVFYSENTGMYYVYPTGGGNGFKVFSSKDLNEWNDEGFVLKLEDVSWENKLPWAPSILEKKIDGKYRYFFFFCAGQKIGVATGDSPTGPFVDSGKPLLAGLPKGAGGGIPIDPDVFTDPVTGKTYLYWGNTFLAVAELKDDFTSLNEETLEIITPPGYFEGPHVFTRNGIYYLTWSQNDTRSIDYRVLYLMATSPTGPFLFPGDFIKIYHPDTPRDRIPSNDNVILQKRPEAEIYGTGHHSVLNVPGTDQWWIVYHRLVTPLFVDPWAREVCKDPLSFNPDGTIQPVQPK